MLMYIGFIIKKSCNVKFRVCSCYISFFYRDGVVSKHRVHVSWVQLLSKTVKVQEAFKCQLLLRKAIIKTEIMLKNCHCHSINKLFLRVFLFVCFLMIHS